MMEFLYRLMVLGIAWVCSSTALMIVLAIANVAVLPAIMPAGFATCSAIVGVVIIATAIPTFLNALAGD